MFIRHRACISQVILYTIGVRTEVEMGQLSDCFSSWWRRALAARGASKDAGGDDRKPCRPGYEAEMPLSFAELVAAAAFLDFGGMLEERRLFGRNPETNSTDCHRD
jgi:hypothetical protein